MQGIRFRLRGDTVAIGFDDAGKRVAVTIPADAEVLVLDPVPLAPATDPDEKVDIRWEERSLKMFLMDLQARGERIKRSA